MRKHIHMSKTLYFDVLKKKIRFHIRVYKHKRTSRVGRNICSKKGVQLCERACSTYYFT